MAIAPYTFEPVAEDHLPLLGRWLAEPHIRTWWGDPEQALTTIADHMADETVQLSSSRTTARLLGLSKAGARTRKKTILAAISRRERLASISS
jgi:hypothetical protein